MNKDEKKMIEEMAKEIYKGATICDGKLCQDCKYHKKSRYADKTNCQCTAIAESLITAGYRKVGEDEIVIKKDEYEELQECDEANARLFTKNCILECSNKKLKKQLEQASKETARAILQEIFTLLHTIKRQDYEDGVPYYSEEVEIFNDRLSEIFNKYSIELED